MDYNPWTICKNYDICNLLSFKSNYMVRNSRNPLPEEIFLKMYSLFFEIFNCYENKESFFELMNDLFTPAEKIMIAKRVGIIYLLIKKVDYRDISEILKVSTCTITHYAYIYNNRKSKIIEIIKSQLMKEKVLYFLDDLLADVMIQPGLKIGHWQQYWDHKRKQQERKILPS